MDAGVDVGVGVDVGECICSDVGAYVSMYGSVGAGVCVGANVCREVEVVSSSRRRTVCS